MNTLIEVFFACVSIAIIILFLPEIIGLGVICAAAFYLISFASGIKNGLNR
jgi:hypothetical protein